MNSSSSTDQGTNPCTHYYSEGIHLTQNFFVDELLVEQVPEGMTFDDNYWTNWCEEAFGITWSSSWIATTPGQNEQKLNLAMVSGDLPDLIIGTGKSLTPMIEGGMVIPLDSLIEQYASPLVKHLMTQMEEATNGSYSDPFSKDGKLYGIPMMADLWATSWNNNWIRRDIIEELGVTTPTTLADLEAIIEKYIAAYPNGYAMLMYAGGSMDTVMEAYGAFPSRWIKDSEGSLVYGSVQPEVKEGLAKLREWYQKSWIDQEFVVKDFSKASEDLVAGNVLSFHGSWGSVWWPFPDMMAVNPDADMVAYAPLTQADGSMKTGIIIAFQDFNPALGFSGSPWVGLKWFKFIFNTPDFKNIFWNTFIIATSKMIFLQVVPILFALMLNEVMNRPLKRIVQTITYLPHFLSWVIIGGIFIDILSTKGIINQFLGIFGIDPIFFLGSNKYFQGTMVVTEVWREFGWASILYLAAIAGVNTDLYEAAYLEGAGRFRRMWHVTMPGIITTVVLLLILNLSGVLNAGFEQILVFYNAAVFETGDILDTFVFRMGIQQAQFSLATAVGLFKSVIGLVLVIITRGVAHKTLGYRVF